MNPQAQYGADVINAEPTTPWKTVWIPEELSLHTEGSLDEMTGELAAEDAGREKNRYLPGMLLWEIPVCIISSWEYHQASLVHAP